MSESNGSTELFKKPRITKDGIEAIGKWAARGGIYALVPVLMWGVTQLDERIDRRVRESAPSKHELSDSIKLQNEVNREMLKELRQLNTSLNVLDKKTAVLSAVIGQRSYE